MSEIRPLAMKSDGVIEEYKKLDSNSRQLFSGLRDLPQLTRDQWKPYFAKTFDIFARLWRFQQAHRPTLELTSTLKRWQIGEIASRIGQLYYHYYLRTSEVNYLHEAFVFYSAIRARRYLSDISPTDRSLYVTKVLRYYARFIVVSLMLRRLSNIEQLLQELEENLSYFNDELAKPHCRADWQIIVKDIQEFVKCDEDQVFDEWVIGYRLPVRLTSGDQHESTIASHFLQEVVIVGCKFTQAKFGELTIDMCRMAQCVEFEQAEIQEFVSGVATESSPRDDDADKFPKRSRQNPHKVLLYKPTIAALLSSLAFSLRELKALGTLLIYVSADNAKITSPSHQHKQIHFTGDGLRTNNRRYDGSEVVFDSTIQQCEIHCLYKQDLITFLRKPLFLIVDSSASAEFLGMPSELFGQPYLALLSPASNPPTLARTSNDSGGLFTLFLVSPLAALCRMYGSQRRTLSVSTCKKATVKNAGCVVEETLTNIVNFMKCCEQIDSVFLRYLSDDFLRMLIARFVFCQITLSMDHRFSVSESYQPYSQPSLPFELLKDRFLQRSVSEACSLIRSTRTTH